MYHKQVPLILFSKRLNRTFYNSLFSKKNIRELCTNVNFWSLNLSKKAVHAKTGDWEFDKQL